jgi:hypothetical protein
MQAPNWDPTEGSGQVFLLDILSHRMSVTAIFRQLTPEGADKGQGLSTPTGRNASEN